LTDLNLPPEILTSGREKQEKNKMDSTEGQKVFTNYLIIGQTQKGYPVYGPKSAGDMIEELRELLPNLIHFNGIMTQLTRNPKTNNLDFELAKDEIDLESMLYEKEILLDFKMKELEIKVKWKPFTRLFKRSIKNYNAFSKYPAWPIQDDHLITGPEIIPKETGVLDRFLDFFNPLTPKDRLLMKAFAVTPSSSLLQGKRPVFVIAGEDGADTTVQIGKSTFAKMIMSLHESHGEMHIEVTPERMIIDLMRIAKERIIRFDNVKGQNKTAILERMITNDYLFGHSFQEGNRSIENHVTFVITSNDPYLSEDLATRSVVIRLAPPKAGETWVEENVKAFLVEHRIEILQDIAYILNLPETGYARPCATRFPMWERTVLHRLTQEDFGSMLKADVAALKDDSEVYREFLDWVTSKTRSYKSLSDHRLCPLEHQIFIASAVMNEWHAEFFKTGYATARGRAGKEVKRVCEKAGMRLIDQTIRIGQDVTRGYILNPRHSFEICYAILTRRQDERFAIKAPTVMNFKKR